MKRCVFVSVVTLFAAASGAPQGVADTPGITKTEIKIGNLMPYSGPVSANSVIGKAEAAYFSMINETGGINGRRINFISLDDGYSPPKAIEQTRKLVEQDEVALMFNPLGTPGNSAIQRYLNDRKIPQLFVLTGADRFSDYKAYPWTIGWQPSYRVEAQIYAKYILDTNPNAKIGVLYQNDDFGKDYLKGLKDVLGTKYQHTTVVSYEVTDPIASSQIVSLRAAGIDTLITAATPKFAAQTIRKIAELGWHPAHFLSNISISVSSVLEPAGLNNAVGIISAAYLKDPSDAAWNDDSGMKDWRAFMSKYLPKSDQNDAAYVYAYGVA